MRNDFRTTLVLNLLLPLFSIILILLAFGLTWRTDRLSPVILPVLSLVAAWLTSNGSDGGRKALAFLSMANGIMALVGGLAFVFFLLQSGDAGILVFLMTMCALLGAVSLYSGYIAGFSASFRSQVAIRRNEKEKAEADKSAEFRKSMGETSEWRDGRERKGD